MAGRSQITETDAGAVEITITYLNEYGFDS